jgi:hypothetical protein
MQNTLHTLLMLKVMRNPKPPVRTDRETLRKKARMKKSLSADRQNLPIYVSLQQVRAYSVYTIVYTIKNFINLIVFDREFYCKKFKTF